MRHALPENRPGRIAGVAVRFLVVTHFVIEEELLDLGGCRETAEHLVRLSQAPVRLLYSRACGSCGSATKSTIIASSAAG